MNAFQKIMFVCLILSLCSFSFAGSLVGHWKLDETSGDIASDSAGTNNGTVFGAVWTLGKIDGALDFDGTNDYVEISDSPALRFSQTDSFSIVFWANPQETSSCADIIGKMRASGVGVFGYGVRWQNNAFSLYVEKSGVSYTLVGTGNGSAPAGDWYHVAAIYNNRNMAIYLNGVCVGTGTWSGNAIGAPDKNLTIGNRSYDSTMDQYFCGNIDDIRIYNYAISDAEVAALYNQTPMPCLVGHWKLDETSGDIASDSAGTNNGTVSGAVWTPGKIDGGLDFDGIDDGVVIPDNDVLTPTNAMTLSYWAMYRNGKDIGVYKIAGCAGEPASPGNSRAYQLSVTGTTGKAFFKIHATAGSVDYLESLSTIPANQWHLITASFNNGAAKVYIDGVLDNSKTMTVSTIMNDVQPLIIGGMWYYCGTDSFVANDGLIDDVRLYNYALDANEVAALYAQAPLPHVATTYHVATTGKDIYPGTTKKSAFATIQKGIDMAVDGDTIVVWPGTYDQQANFNGKAITVKSADAEPAVISNSSDYAFIFENAERANSVLQNFIIAKGCFAVYVSGSSPTIKNLTIVDNYFGIDAYDGGNPAVSNCIFLNNRFGDIEGADAQYSWRIGQTNAPVSYWKFEETTGTKALDSVGNNDGTITGATREPNGLLGQAMLFDSSSDYITVPDNASLDITGDITLMAWVKPTRLSGKGGTPIASKWAASSYAYSLRIQLSPQGSSPAFSLSTNGSSVSTSIYFSDLILTTNEWNHIVVKREGSVMTAWLNGQESQLSGTFTGPIYASTDPFTIGSSFFHGEIDEVAIYNRALSSAEIQNFYKASSTGYDYIDPMMVDPEADDYHLLSEYGRFDPPNEPTSQTSGEWVLDDVTSPCVDAGDPTDNPMGEPMPNGGRINIGAYGGMGHASKGGQWPLAFDYNIDGIVNFADFAKFAEHWLDKLPWVK